MNASTSSTSTHRARWAAIGAAVAVSLGAGGLGIVSATSPEGASAYVPITPCRIMDTRPGDSQVGAQVGPLVGPDAEITVDGWGDVAGDCNLPTDSTGLQLNVTATDASQLTNLRFYPEGADTPTASNLNPAPGQPPTPNGVAVSLNTTNGQFHAFNRFGSVNLVIDVQGYFTDHMHDGTDIVDESLTGADVADESLTGADVDDASLTPHDIRGMSGLNFSFAEDNVNLAGGPEVVSSVEMHQPGPGWVVVSVTGNFQAGTAGVDQARCQITTGTDFEADAAEFWPSDGGEDLVTLTQYGFSGHRTIEVAGLATVLQNSEFNLLCDELSGGVSMNNIEMVAEYFPTRYPPNEISIIPFPIIPIGP